MNMKENAVLKYGGKNGFVIIENCIEPNFLIDKTKQDI